MIMRPSILLPLLLVCCTGNAQYNGPESVEYDAVGDRYFVSNTGSSLIKVRSQAGVVTDFVAVSPAPYGLEIKGDTLFACSGGSVKGYLLSNASPVFNLNLGGSGPAAGTPPAATPTAQGPAPAAADPAAGGAGWHPDPTGRHQQRWWDGQLWTDHVADGGATSADPLGVATGV